MSDVFVSYKAEDRRRVKPLVEALQADGYAVWWDAQIGGGANYRRAPTSSQLKVTERFKRTSPTSIHYEFTVEDPEVFVGPWRGELPLQQMPTPIYEYACHEGNYALPGILAGAHEEEKAGKVKN